jgi:outer membrane protein OmpA-like peptidoglycan-associated protein
MSKTTAIICALCLAALPVRGEDARTVLGEWVGTYVCAQGLTGLTLTISEATPTSARALFHFYADPRNPGVPTGCFTMNGEYNPETGQLQLEGNEWLQRPRGYWVVNFDGEVDAEGKSFAGVVTGPRNCTRFDLARTASPAPASSQCVIPDAPPVQDDLETAGAIGEALAGKGSVALNILFTFDSATILPEGMVQLDELGRSLLSPAFAARRVGIYGHTDSVGSEDYNQKLSEQRAEAVRDYLFKRFRIPPERFETYGFGGSLPKFPDAPEDPGNRRVEIALLEWGPA